MCHLKLSLLIQHCMVCIKPIEYDVLTLNYLPHRMPKVLIRVPWIRVTTLPAAFTTSLLIRVKARISKCSMPDHCLYTLSYNMPASTKHVVLAFTHSYIHTKLCRRPNSRHWYDFLGAPGSLVDAYPLDFHTDTKLRAYVHTYIHASCIHNYRASSWFRFAEWLCLYTSTVGRPGSVVMSTLL